MSQLAREARNKLITYYQNNRVRTAYDEGGLDNRQWSHGGRSPHSATGAHEAQWPALDNGRGQSNN